MAASAFCRGTAVTFQLRQRSTSWWICAFVAAQSASLLHLIYLLSDLDQRHQPARFLVIVGDRVQHGLLGGHRLA